MARFLTVQCPKMAWVSGDVSSHAVVRAGMAAAGVSKGRTSLRGGLEALAGVVGPVHRVALATWLNTGETLARHVRWLEARFGACRVSVACRWNVVTLQAEACARIVGRWGERGLLCAESHVEAGVVEGENGTGVWTGSGTLDDTGRFEWHCVDRRPEVAAWWLAWFDSLPVLPARAMARNDQIGLASLAGREWTR